MSNRAYLTVTPWERIYPSAGDLAFSPQAHTALASAGCVPLLWIAAFSEADLREHTFDPKPPQRPSALTLRAPLAPTSAALERLLARKEWLASLYADRGALGYHVDLWLSHLRTYEGAWISIELEEIAALARPGAFDEELRACLSLLDRRAPEVRERLAALSTVLLDQRFVTLSDAPKATRQEQWNFFRLLGEGWGKPTPWD